MITYFDLDPVKFATSTCILVDEAGNVFRVYITAPNKKDVIDFVKNKLQTGEVKISVTVSSLEEKAPYFQGYTDPEFGKGHLSADDNIVLEGSPQPAANEAFVLGFDPVKIGISRVKLNRDEKYRVKYNIDPPLGFGEVRYSGYNDSNIEVLCQAPVGQIGTSLLEKRYANNNIYTFRRKNVMARPGADVYFRENSLYTGEWLIKVEGQDPGGNSYQLSYVRAVG